MDVFTTFHGKPSNIYELSAISGWNKVVDWPTDKPTLPSLDPSMAQNIQIKTATNTCQHRKTNSVHTHVGTQLQKKEMDFCSVSGSQAFIVQTHVNTHVAPPLGARHTLCQHSPSAPTSSHPLLLPRPSPASLLPPVSPSYIKLPTVCSLCKQEIVGIGKIFRWHSKVATGTPHPRTVRYSNVEWELFHALIQLDCWSQSSFGIWMPKERGFGYVQRAACK